MKKAIVTGANGFVGSALCKELSDSGYKVIAVVKNPKSDISKIIGLPDLKIIYCDLANFKNLTNLIEDGDIDILYHLAWVGSAGPLRCDSDIQINNIKYTCDTVKACAEINCRRIVFASSIMEYEVQALIAANIIPGISTLYSSAKAAASHMARTIAGSFGVDYIRAVISNIYGPGELSPRLINTTLRKLLSGQHCAFTAGEQIYDFIYITDAAKTFKIIGEKGISNKTYYIGSQNPKPLKEFLFEMRDQINSEIEIGLGEIPFKGISLTYNEFDISAVKNDTGFIPEIEFAEGIKKTIEWIKEVY